MKSVLLHICCGVCSCWPILKLREDGYDVKGLFYNPNIQPEDEYCRRMQAARQVCHSLGVQLIEGDYACEEWNQNVSGLEREPEGGARCSLCYAFRISYAAEKRRELHCDYLATTLSVSPHKNALTINSIGKREDPEGFLEYDFKKADGFKKTAQAAKEAGIYRQNYCGCLFSKR